MAEYSSAAWQTGPVRLLTSILVWMHTHLQVDGVCSSAQLQRYTIYQLTPKQTCLAGTSAVVLVILLHPIDCGGPGGLLLGMCAFCSSAMLLSSACWWRQLRKQLSPGPPWVHRPLVENVTAQAALEGAPPAGTAKLFEAMGCMGVCCRLA